MKNGVWNFFVQATLIHPLEEIEYTQFVHYFCDMYSIFNFDSEHK